MNNVEIEVQVLRALLALCAKDYGDAESILKGLANKLRNTNNISMSLKEFIYKNKLSEDDFINKYCRKCGSQRCEGIGTESFEGCIHKEFLDDAFKRVNECLNSFSENHIAKI